MHEILSQMTRLVNASVSWTNLKKRMKIQVTANERWNGAVNSRPLSIGYRLNVITNLGEHWFYECNLPDDDDESLLLDELLLLESLDSLLSLLDELDECRLRLLDLDFFFFFELLLSLRLSGLVLPLMADEASPRVWSDILMLSAKTECNRLLCGFPV